MNSNNATPDVENVSPIQTLSLIIIMAKENLTHFAHSTVQYSTAQPNPHMTRRFSVAFTKMPIWIKYKQMQHMTNSQTLLKTENVSPEYKSTRKSKKELKKIWLA